ncbi:MAG: radical SAM protein [Candidatus Woesearchaeota archaeon]
MEFPLIDKKWNKNQLSIDIAYPNLYYGGSYSLAVITFYNIINRMRNWACNRVYLDKGNLSSDLIGFTIHYELDYRNVLEMLKRNGIQMSKEGRKRIVFAGGPCIINNPDTLSEYLDFMFIGEADENIVKVLECYEKDHDKENFLDNIKDIPGVYVPGKSKTQCYALVEDLDKVPYPLYQPLPENMTKDFVFGRCFILETERGCPYKCKFCSVGTFYKGIRMRSLESIKKIIDEGIKLNRRNKVVIYSPSFVHKDRKDILKHMISKGLEFSVPSIKAETLDDEMLELIPKGGQKTLTLAPECNESLRIKINKNVKDEVFFRVIEMANRHGIRQLKYYFLFGIPDQTEEDIKETVKFIKKLKEKFKGKTYVSFNALVGKPKTEFQGIGFDKAKLKKQSEQIKKELSKIGVKIKVSGIATSEMEYDLAYAKSYKP